MSEMPTFFSELKRRNVYKVAVAYAVVGWLVIQISSTVLPTFHAPEWVVQTLMVIIAIGFPIALVIAWAFEATPEGIKRTEAADAANQHSGGKAWIYSDPGRSPLGRSFLCGTLHGAEHQRGRGGRIARQVDRGATVRKPER